MSFVSYAQNCEDVLLWRALGRVGAGFYIDVGANHPDTDSVTRAFYDRGWHGIDIEPVAADAGRLAASRPRDIVLPLAAGAAEGEAEFFVVPGTGLSTFDAEARAGAAAAGHATRSARVRVRPLAAICREHAKPVIHFLKIDAEGSELAVLQGADFTAFRPWIVLVEATAPLSTLPSHAAWEPILLAAGYHFVWFDGLNRFYVAGEHHAALAPHFATPPNVFDDFIRVADSDLARRIALLEAEAAALRGQAAHAAAAITRLHRLAAARAQEVGALRGSVARLRHEAADIEPARQQARIAAAWVAALRGSTSWRLTAPLRRATVLLAAASGRTIESLPELAEVPPPPVPAMLPPPAPRPALRAVHQFHPGSATGDAITNAMLLTRTLLRDLGFASEIYVEHRDADLDAELRLLDEVPLHGDYVLILRHSLGHDVFDRLASLPAPKILHYHNITPPEFLPASGPLRHYARLGRQQLAQWRGRVVACLADSDYNALELRRAGFDPVQTCTLLFDSAALRAAAEAAPRRQDDRFTLLFVGRLNDAKGQRELVAAYALFRKQFDRPSRLILVGRPDGGDYLDELTALIHAEGLAGHAVVTGPVDDAELHAWYAAADLYVSLSRHEGFGVPLVEAMAHGVPVLAWPAGAVPYTLGGAARLLTGRDAPTVAAAMLALAADPVSRTAIAARQRASLDRFALERQMPALLTALARAGAVPPEAPALRAALAANMQFTVTGHVRGSYSLAAINRALAAALEGSFPGRVRLLAPPEEDAADISPPESGPHVVISQHYPVLVPRVPGDLDLALFFWEESLIPADTIATLANNFAGVLAPSRFVARALLDSGLPLPVRVVGHAPDLTRFAAQRLARPDKAAVPRPFTFLHVSSCFPRKGIDVLLAAYARAFRAGAAVRLVIKTFPNPHNDAADQLARLRAADPGLAPVELIDGDLDADALAALYGEADAMVLPSRGEGFNLPAAEAMAAGLRLIVTGAGGHADFCDAGNARLIAWRYAGSGSHLATPLSVWAEPDIDDLTAALREAADPAQDFVWAERTARAVQMAAQLADAPAFAKRVAAAALDLLLTPPVAKLRLGVVSTWDVRCGVAEYTRHLLGALAQAEGIGAITLFADHRTPPGGAAGMAETMRVVPCWERGQGDSVGELATAMAAADPAAVLIQHQPGLFGWGALAALLACPGMAGRVAVVTLHTTRHLTTVAPEERAAALAALSGASRVIVHTLADLDLLRRLGLVENVTLLPHGTSAPLPARTPRALPKAAAPLIGCYGFFLPDKGIAQLIGALAQLRAQWPGARLRLVNAEYPHPNSAAEIAACRAAATKAGLERAIEWHTGFLPHAESLALLAGCDMVALPYQTSLEASSAALRTALAAGVPVLVTKLPLFDEAEAAVLRAGGTDAAALAAALTAALTDTAARAATQAAAQAWLAARDWARVASRLGGLLRGLVASGEDG